MKSARSHVCFEREGWPGGWDTLGIDYGHWAIWLITLRATNYFHTSRTWRTSDRALFSLRVLIPRRFRYVQLRMRKCYQLKCKNETRPRNDLICFHMLLESSFRMKLSSPFKTPRQIFFFENNTSAQYSGFSSESSPAPARDNGFSAPGIRLD